MSGPTHGSAPTNSIETSLNPGRSGRGQSPAPTGLSWCAAAGRCGHRPLRKGGEAPSMTLASGAQRSVCGADRRKGWGSQQRSFPKCPATSGNPSVAAKPRQLPLHKGALPCGGRDPGGVRLGCGFRRPNSKIEFGASVMVTPPYGMSPQGAAHKAPDRRIKPRPLQARFTPASGKYTAWTAQSSRRTPRLRHSARMAPARAWGSSPLQPARKSCSHSSLPASATPSLIRTAKLPALQPAGG